MQITLNATTTGAGNYIKQYYVVFYDHNSGTELIDPATFISNAQTRINSNYTNGFLLAYGQEIKAGDVGNNSYVWDPTVNAWVNITTLTAGYNICGLTNGSKDCTGKKYLTVQPVTAAPAWQVGLYQTFGTKTMYTAGYVLDANNLCREIAGLFHPR